MEISKELVEDKFEEETNALFDKDSQQIILTGKDGISVPITGQNITVTPNTTCSSCNSNKMKIHNIVDFSWETKFYVGKLISVHLSGVYMAYALKGRRTREGIVRVINHKTGLSSMIKARRQVKDLAFAHKTDQVLLAFVDNVGSLFIYEILEEESRLVSNIVLQVNRKADSQFGENNRVIWCPYIPEDSTDNNDLSDDNQDISKLLVSVHESEAYIWNIDAVTKEYGKGVLSFEDIKMGFQTVVTGHSMTKSIVSKIQSKRTVTEYYCLKPIRDAVFSPDGYVLAVASANGVVQFFEVFSEEENALPRCLHQWTPHGGKPVSCLFFVDDHKNPKTNVQFWRFAITGADNNQEIKLWSCEMWICLQTIRFQLPLDGNAQSRLKAELDLSGAYFLLSDVGRKILYVLEIEEDLTKKEAKISFITEYFLDQPVLSFVILDALISKPLCIKESSKAIKDKHSAGECVSLNKGIDVCLKLIWINAKSLQECHIFLKCSADSFSHPDIFQDAFAYCDKLSDFGSDGSSPDSIVQNSMQSNGLSTTISHSAGYSSPTKNISTHTPSPKAQNCRVDNFLLTPEDFISSSPTTANKTEPHVQSSPSAASIPVTWEELDVNTSTSNAGNDVKASVSSINLPTNNKQNLENSPLMVNLVANDDGSLGTKLEHSQLTTVNSAGNDDSLLLDKKISSSNLSEFESLKENSLIKNTENKSGIKSDIQRLPFIANVNNNEENTKQWTANTLCKLQKLQLSVSGLIETVPQLIELLKEQQNCICKLQQKVSSHHKHMKMLSQLQHQIRQIDQTLCLNMEKVVRKQVDSEFHNLDATIIANFEDDDWVDKQTDTLSEIVNSSIEHKLEKSVKNEIRNNILPYMTNFLETFQHQLLQDLNQKLTTTEHTVKETIGKLLRNKVFTENLGYSVVSAVEPQVHNTCLEVNLHVISPSLDKACQSLLQQINENFGKGIQEYIHQVDLYLTKQSQKVSNNDEISVSKIKEESGEIKLFTEELIESYICDLKKELDNYLQEVLSKKEEKMLIEMKKLIRQEIDDYFKEQAKSSELASLRSCASTPLPPMLDLQALQQQIMQLIEQGQLSAAFQKALSAANLNLVVYTCKAVDPSTIFDHQHCPLQQHVILSLIQQLVADLTTQVEIKLRYVEAAIIHLDMSNPVTKEHGRSILKILHQKLSTFLQLNPNHKLRPNVRMMLLATRSLCNSN